MTRYTCPECGMAVDLAAALPDDALPECGQCHKPMAVAEPVYMIAANVDTLAAAILSEPSFPTPVVEPRETRPPLPWEFDWDALLARSAVVRREWQRIGA